MLKTKPPTVIALAPGRLDFIAVVLPVEHPQMIVNGTKDPVVRSVDKSSNFYAKFAKAGAFAPSEIMRSTPKYSLRPSGVGQNCPCRGLKRVSSSSRVHQFLGIIHGRHEHVEAPHLSLQKEARAQASEKEQSQQKCGTTLKVSISCRKVMH